MTTSRGWNWEGNRLERRVERREGRKTWEGWKWGRMTCGRGEEKERTRWRSWKKRSLKNRRRECDCRQVLGLPPVG